MITMSANKPKKWEVKISVIVDYKPTFLNSLKTDLSHKFDIPEKNIRIECIESTDYAEMFKFLEGVIEKNIKK